MKTYPRYKRYDLGKQLAGTVVEVALSCVNNVRLMDAANFRLYADGKAYRFFGGRIDKSPTRLTIPAGGHWFVVVDWAGFQTLANSNVRAIPPVAGLGERPDSEATAVTRIVDELNNYKHIAYTDTLTGLANRRAFDERIEQAFAIGDQRNANALILTDIDHFKSFNDTHGHAVGDMVLRKVAAAIRRALPGYTFPARTGGEEFAIIMEGSTRNDAWQIAETIRKAVEAHDFTDEASGTDYGPVTISLGLCMADQAASVHALYTQADAALYASKRAGRNRTTRFAPETCEGLAEPQGVADHGRLEARHATMRF